MLSNIIIVTILLSIAGACLLIIRKNNKQDIHITSDGFELKFLDINPASNDHLDAILKDKYALLFCIASVEKVIFIESDLSIAIKKLEEFKKHFESISLDAHYSLRLNDGQTIYRSNILKFIEENRTK
jgi:hypothetical protein